MDPKNVTLVESSRTVFAICDKGIEYFLCDRNPEGEKWDLGITKDSSQAITWSTEYSARKALYAFIQDGVIEKHYVDILTGIAEITRQKTIRLVE